MEGNILPRKLQIHMYICTQFVVCTTLILGIILVPISNVMLCPTLFWHGMVAARSSIDN